MKKICFLITIVLLAFTSIHSQDFTYNNLDFTINDDEVTVTLLGHADGYAASGELNIPTTAYYQGYAYTVTAIDSYAFSGCGELYGSLIIPNTVETIGDFAFYRVYDLSSLTLSNSLRIIGNDAFDYCHFTGIITIPASIESIGNNPFNSCQTIDGFTVESGNNHYDSRNNCNAIIETTSNTLIIGCKNSTIPHTVTTIANEAFAYCRSLDSIIIPSSVNSIGNQAFCFCTGLNSINIPSSLNSIEGNPFMGCYNISEITVDDGNVTFDSRNGCNAVINTNTNELVIGCQNTIIPDNITSIGEYAFFNCQNMAGELIIPNSVTTIGNYAFSNCSELSGTLSIPNSVTYIGKYAFTLCNGFDELVLGESITTIDDMAFEWCTGFHGSLVVPNSVKTIGSAAFDSCTGFDGTLTLSSNLDTIKPHAFTSCYGFTQIIPLSTTPPYTSNSFVGLNNTLLVVPCGYLDAYENSTWGSAFYNIIQNCEANYIIDEDLTYIYPNPSYGSIKIEAENIHNIVIYNILGEKVFESEVNGDTFEYDFEGHDNGVYFTRVETARFIVTQRVIVRH